MLTATFPFAQCFVSLKIRIYILLIETCYSVVLVYQQNASWSCICCGLDSCSYYDRGWVLSPAWYEKNRFLGKSIAKKRNPLLSRNRLIKCHSTVTNKYLLHDICVAGIGSSLWACSYESWLEIRSEALWTREPLSLSSKKW